MKKRPEAEMKAIEEQRRSWKKQCEMRKERKIRRQDDERKRHFERVKQAQVLSVLRYQLPFAKGMLVVGEWKRRRVQEA